jgi:hypothetical protein
MMFNYLERRSIFLTKYPIDEQNSLLIWSQVA